MTYSLFHLCNGNKTLVRAFEEFEAAKNHANSLFGDFVACEEDEDNAGSFDILTLNGEVLAIEPNWYGANDPR